MIYLRAARCYARTTMCLFGRCVAAFFILAVTACAGTIPQDGGMPQRHGSVAFENATTAQHLYVSDRGAKVVLRYPLTNGIPAAAPDAVIGGFSLPRGVAVGPDHRLYVIDRGAETLDIFAPAPTSSSRPVRALPIGHANGLGTVAVDPSGNVYVSYTVGCGTDGFTCGNADVYSSFAGGLHFIKTLHFGGGPGGALIRSMAFEPSGLMVEESGAQNPFVFAGAPNIGNPYPVFCGAENNAGDVWGPVSG
jgi:hypothetical protein